MQIQQALSSVALAVVPVAIAAVLWRRRGPQASVPSFTAAATMGVAALLAIACSLLEGVLWGWTGLSLEAAGGDASEALLSMFLFAAPLEEGAKVLAIWPLYRAHRIEDPRSGLILGVAAGLGFAAAEGSWLVATSQDGFLIVRCLVGLPAHVLCAAVWGPTLGARLPSGWFSKSWVLAMLLHGLCDHLTFGRGPGVIVLTGPLLLTLGAIAYGVFRKAAQHQAALDASLGAGEEIDWDELAEPHSIREVWLALQPKRHGLTMRWVALSAAVTAGVALSALALGLYLGNAMGLDFASADETDIRSNGPLLFLATAVGLAFPTSGYLVARATGAQSAMEAGTGAALAVLGAVLMLSVTTPIAAIFTLALAPVAFALASAGAWFALGR